MLANGEGIGFSGREIRGSWQSGLPLNTQKQYFYVQPLTTNVHYTPIAHAILPKENLICLT